MAGSIRLFGDVHDGDCMIWTRDVQMIGKRVRMYVALVLTVAAALLPPHQSSAAEIARYQPEPPPRVSAKAVFVKDISSGAELFAENPDEPLPPASLTKIAVALVVLDFGRLDDMVTITDADLVPLEESQVGLVAGDRLSIRNLLFGALIPSGNDATLALARYIGSASLEDGASDEDAVNQFIAMMNEKAKSLGATASTFLYPTGIDVPGHVMSARDVATLTAAALSYPLFAEIVSTPSVVLPSEVRPDGYAVVTTNQLLVDGVANGVKTGSTPAAGGCLATSFTVGPNTIVSVVLGSDVVESAEGVQDNSARFNDSLALVDAVQDDFQWIDPTAPGELTGFVEELGVWDVALERSVLLPVPIGGATQLRYRLDLDPPADDSADSGEVQFYLGNALLSEQPMIQAN